MLQIEDYRLPNGLRVVLNEDHSAPLVAVNLWYHVGSKNERPGRTGFAHLFEHLLFSGSENVGNNEHFRYVQSVGGVLNGSTFFDRTNYYETLPSNYLALGLWLEADRMGFFLSAITQEKLDIQREVVKEERRMRVENQPYGKLNEIIYDQAFTTHPYKHPTIGSMADLEAALSGAIGECKELMVHTTVTFDGELKKGKDDKGKVSDDADADADDADDGDGADGED